MKYKYIRLKYIFPTIILLLAIILTMLFFVGGLEAQAMKYDNIEWDLDGFMSAKDIGEGNLNEARFVADTNKYAMVINEKTTIVSVYEKLNGWNKNTPTENAKLLYQSAQPNGNGDAKSNFILHYYNVNGKSSSIPSFAKSVQYESVTTGTTERFYQLRYNESEDYVDILYAIGDFTPVIIPKKFLLDDFERFFIGNTVVFTSADDEMRQYCTVLDLEGNVTEEKGLQMKYKDFAYCLNNEAAYYILQNNLGVIEYTSDGVDSIAKYNTLPSDAKEILDRTGGFWKVTGILDENGNLKMVMGKDYNTSVDSEGKLLSPVIINPYLTQSMINQITSTNVYTPLNVDENGGLTSTKWYLHDDVFTRRLDLKAQNVSVLQALYNYMYVGGFTTVDDEIIYNEHTYKTTKSASGNEKLIGTNVYFDYNGDGKITIDEKYQYGGFQKRDESGNFVYTYNKDNTIYRPVQSALTTEDAIEQNNLFNEESIAKTIAFELCIRFQLESNGIKTTIIHDSIKEGVGSDNKDESIEGYLKHDNKLNKIELCKYATLNSNAKSEGQIVLPDGSGGIISFNSVKSDQYAQSYPEKRIYGSDFAIMQMTRGNNTEKMMLPMYGFIETSNERAIVAIVDKGAAQTSISADYLRKAGGAGMLGYNYAYFTTYYRESEKVTVTSNTEYVKINNDFLQTDVTYQYILMSGNDITYVDVAKKYREYLLNKYPELQDISDETTTSTPTLTFIGAYEKKTFKLGFVYNGEYSLTTFKQAQSIVEELKSKGIDSMSVAYRSWTEDERNQKTRTNFTVSHELGGKKELINLSNYLNENGFKFYPEYYVANGRGYKMPFGAIKYSSKSISGSYASSISYVLSTGLEDATSGRGNFISPIYYKSLVTKFLRNYSKYNISGIYLSDLGNKSVADYSKNIQLFTSGSTQMQKNALYVFKEKENIMLNAPFDYAFEHCDVATVVPVESTLYGSIDYSVPLYQLVVSGLFDYSSKPVNYNNDLSITWNLLKAIETGSNIAFVLSYEDTNVLLDTRYTEYYDSYYSNWKENILYMNDILNSTGIYASRLVDHRYLSDNVVKVTYQNGLEIIINFDNGNYYDQQSGLSVRSNWYAIVKEGN